MDMSIKAYLHYIKTDHDKYVTSDAKIIIQLDDSIIYLERWAYTPLLARAYISKPLPFGNPFVDMSFEINQ